MRYLYLLLVLSLTACDLFDEEEDAPSFIYIKGIDLSTSPGQGANTEGIIDAHVFANDAFVGTFELPANVPILESGNTTISVAAGIRRNGISSDRIIYPFYANFRESINLIPAGVQTLSPDSVIDVSYFNSGIGFFVEGFEDIGNVWVSADDEIPGIINTQDPAEVRSGTGSGKVTLTDDQPLFEVYSSTGSWDLSVIQPGSIVYMELDFKGNNPVEVGIRTLAPVQGKVFALGLVPTEEWIKVYVDLSNEIGQSQAQDFQIYIEAEKVTTDDEATIFLDNIKVIYPD